MVSQSTLIAVPVIAASFLWPALFFSWPLLAGILNFVTTWFWPLIIAIAVSALLLYCKDTPALCFESDCQRHLALMPATPTICRQLQSQRVLLRLRPPSVTRTQIEVSETEFAVCCKNKLPRARQDSRKVSKVRCTCRNCKVRA